MSYFSDASLVLVPSAQKSGKVYSIKPTDGTGDLTFTRTGDTATRVGPDGLIEKVRTNLVKSSGDISTQSTFWTSNQSGSTTQNAAVAPDGTTTASQITSAGSAYSGVQQGSISVAAVPHTYSCYLKAVSGTPTVRLTFYDGVTFHQGNFTITSEWVRYSFTFTPLAGSFTVYNTCSSVATWLAWGAMLQSGDIMTDYIATTTAAVSVGPVANVPRLDYSGGSSCPRLLLEPQTTAVTTYSEQIDNAAWGKQNVSVTANNTVSPSGYVDADKIVEDTANSTHFVSNNFTASTATSHTFSVFAKMGERKYLCFAGSNVGAFSATYDLEAGTVVGVTGATASIEDYGNGWYRCVAVKVIASAGGVAVRIGTGTTATVASSGLTQSYLGDGTSGLFIWGVNVTATAYPQSYIPTLGAAVTRGADAASKTGISSLIGQTEGTLFLDFIYEPKLAAGETTYRVSLSDGTYSNRGTFIVDASANSANVVCGSVVTPSTNLLVGQRYKVAFSYKTNDFAFYVNGSQVSYITSGASIPASLTQFQFSDAANIASRTFAGPISQALLFKTRLSNADLAALTA